MYMVYVFYWLTYPFLCSPFFFYFLFLLLLLLLSFLLCTQTCTIFSREGTYGLPTYCTTYIPYRTLQ